MDLLNRLIQCLALSRSFLIVVLSAASLSAKAQSDDLSSIARKYREDQIEAETRVKKFLKKSPAGRVVPRLDGSIMLLVDVSESGVPIYIKSDNAEVATSLNVDELREGGSLGLNLEGSGIEIGMWDEGRPRIDHVEYVGRVTQVDNPSQTFIFHSSHVLGTMIASGVNPAAKGMAPKATVLAFDFFSDVSEMVNQAATDQTSIILSNHSYGTLSGWDNGTGSWVWHGDASISNVRDWKFGFYNSTSNLYDDIAVNAPYYLIVKSAGNDRTDVGDGSRPPDCDPFDCIPTNGVAKNILTVGAVKKLSGPYTGPADVEITSFSSFGPADDGRIKPDIVAPGQSVISASASASNAYAPASGTSMSAPATTGTLALLQELHKNLNAGSYMKAATLKALAIHSAREAGPAPGPDYMFGWGLLDAEAAAKILIDEDGQNIIVEERVLANGDIFELTLTPKENTKITATLVWNDPAGPVLAPALNPTTKMLINDLDLTLVDDGGTQQFPWKLNPATPSAEATKGVNTIDNVEKLEFDLAQPRDYKLRVSHKGTLDGGSQDFSLILSYSSVIDPRVTYYWVGDGGNWNDGSKWSLSSGGVPANIVPGQNDVVVFDENSFSSAGEVVNVTQDQECYSFRWFANEATQLALNDHTITIMSGMTVLSDKITSPGGGTIRFEGNTETNATVNINSNVLSTLDLTFSGDGAHWTLLGNLTIGELRLESGTLMTSGNTITASSISTPGLANKSLILSNTIITGASTLNVDFSDVIIEATTSSFEVPIGLSVNFDFGSGTPFGGSINLAGGAVALSGSGMIGKVSGKGNVNVDGDFVWNDFTLNPGSSFVIAELSQQTFADVFDLKSTAANRTTVMSAGPQTCTIILNENQKICLDNLDISNVSLTGQATVGVGLNSILTNAAGWTEKACNEILFADFDVDFTCEKASVFFNDKSSGPIVTRTWNFGDGSAPQVESNNMSPIHFYETAGSYAVTLTVSDGLQSDEYSATIEIVANALGENKIELNNGKLISFLPAEKYQWVLNGELLDQTDLRSIDFSNGFGEYKVLIFDESCNKTSVPFLVTSLHEGILGDQVSIFPNPAVNSVEIQSRRPVLGIRLINGMGQAISVKSETIESNLRLDVGAIPRGLYILQIQYDEGIFNHRVLLK